MFVLFFIILLFEFWRFSTVLLLIIQNTGNTPLILKIVSQCFFFSFLTREFCFLLLQIFSIYLCYKLLLQIFVNYLCYQILKACSILEIICYCRWVCFSAGNAFLQKRWNQMERWVQGRALFLLWKKQTNCRVTLDFTDLK